MRYIFSIFNFNWHFKGRDLQFSKKVTDDFKYVENKSKSAKQFNRGSNYYFSLSGVQEFPMRIKCATMAWHTLLSALEKNYNFMNELKEK